MATATATVGVGGWGGAITEPQITEALFLESSSWMLPVVLMSVEGVQKELPKDKPPIGMLRSRHNRKPWAGPVSDSLTG